MQRKYQLIRHLPILLGVLLVILLVLGVLALGESSQQHPVPKRWVQQITVLPPPAPSPMPEPPEPAVTRAPMEEPEAVPENEPEPAQDEADAPTGEELALDAEGQAGSDAFRLAAHKGGRSLLGGTRGSNILWYGGQLKQRLDEALREALTDTPARQQNYSVVLEVWVDPDGGVTRLSLVTASGKAEVDHAIRTGLSKLRVVMPKPPPENMPQPVRIQMDSQH